MFVRPVLSRLSRQLRPRSSLKLVYTMLPTAEVAAMRLNYENEKFDESNLVAKEPMGQFDAWFRQAANTQNVGEANAMTLTTCSADGHPSARVVLLKGYSEKGFCFYTNYDSRKGTELNENPFVSLLFYWHCLHRQVRVEGKAQKLSNDESEQYFHSRPRASQMGACISNQSCVIASREVLEKKMEELKETFADESKEIPKPSNWGGYLVVPEMVEFWQGQSSRLHDRIAFRKPKHGETVDPNLTKVGTNGWVYERLSP